VGERKIGALARHTASIAAMRECRFHLDASARTVAPFMPARDENQACGGSISVPLSVLGL
jgi:hypothetical protein